MAEFTNWRCPSGCDPFRDQSLQVLVVSGRSGWEFHIHLQMRMKTDLFGDQARKQRVDALAGAGNRAAMKRGAG